MKDKIEYSKELIEKVVEKYNPYAILLLFSGGDDSTTILNLAHQLTTPTHIVHCNTTCGIKDTLKYVRNEAAKFDIPYIEQKPPNTTYEKWVLRNGMPGRQGHRFMYQYLKDHTLSKIISSIRQKKRNRKIVLITGARKTESTRRMGNAVDVKEMGSNVWVNLINVWEKLDTLQYLDKIGVKRNPVSVNLHGSKECLCGTYAHEGELKELQFFYPKDESVKMITRLDKHCKEKFGWGWGDEVPKWAKLHKAGQMFLPGFEPMCQNCKINTK